MKIFLAMFLHAFSIVFVITASLIGMLWGWGIEAKNWGWIAFSYMSVIVPAFLQVVAKALLDD